jgi:hypothetical protein
MATAVDSRKFLSVGEAAHELRVSKASIYRAVERGTLAGRPAAAAGDSADPRDALGAGAATMSWQLHIPHLHRDQTPAEALAANADGVLEGEDRRVAAQLLFDASVDPTVSTVGDLLDRIERADGGERREILDDTRRNAGLESATDTDAHRELRWSARWLAGDGSSSSAARPRSSRTSPRPATALIPLRLSACEGRTSCARRRGGDAARRDRPRPRRLGRRGNAGSARPRETPIAERQRDPIALHAAPRLAG